MIWRDGGGYNKVYISKVFTDTPVPEDIFNLDNVIIGGTGFYYDKAQPLPYEIEHSFPDYDLYNEWLGEKIRDPKYKDYRFNSIGFLTRDCFRKCSFCVNQNYNRVVVHSPLEEFLDKQRRYICLLDDNFLGYPKWRDLLDQLNSTGKKFYFKQGLDERLLTKEKIPVLFDSNYYGDFTFAFDDVGDSELIESKLRLIREYTDRPVKFYVLVGYDRSGRYNNSFWHQDIVDMFKRIDILRKYHALPYVMRYQRYTDSPYRGMYINAARWCNQPSLFKKMSFTDFIDANSRYGNNAPGRYYELFIRNHPDFSKDVFNKKWEDYHL